MVKNTLAYCQKCKIYQKSFSTSDPEGKNFLCNYKMMFFRCYFISSTCHFIKRWKRPFRSIFIRYLCRKI